MAKVLVELLSGIHRASVVLSTYVEGLLNSADQTELHQALNLQPGVNVQGHSDRLTEVVSGFVAAQPGQYPRKNAPGTAIEYGNDRLPVVNLVTAAAYTFSATDGSAENGFVVANPTTDATYTIPLESLVNFAVYESLQGHNNSNFNVVIQGGAGVTFQSITIPPGAGFYIYKTASDTWASFHSNQGKVWNELGTTYNSTVIDVTGVILSDNSIPQSSEGTEVITVTVTPFSASSQLVVQVQAFVSETTNAGDSVVACVFRDSETDPVNGGVAASILANSQSNLTHMNLSFESEKIPSGSTTPTTFRLRIGSNGTATSLNRINGAPLYGGKITSFVRVWEIL